MKYFFLILLTISACSNKKDDLTFYQNKEHYVFKLKIPNFDKLELKEKLYIYYISKMSEELEKIRRDQKNKTGDKIFKFFNNIDSNSSDLDETLSKKIKAYLYKLKFFSSNYFEMKKILPEFSYSDIESVCLRLENNKTYATCRKDLLTLNAEIFDEKYKPTLISSSMYDPIKNSSINLYGDAVSIFNLKTLSLKEDDKFSYFFKDSSGRIAKENFCTKYSLELNQVIANLNEAKKYASDSQVLILGFLIDYYKSCSYSKFTEYRIAWDYDHNSSLLSGFIEKVYDPLNERGLVANLLFAKTKDSSQLKRYTLYNALGFVDGQNSMYLVLPDDFNMKTYGANRLINASNVSGPILSYFKNIFTEYYSPKYKKYLEGDKVLRFKLEEIKDRFMHNILIDKKNESLINVKYPFINELNAYAKAILFVLENDTFGYMDLKNASFLAVYEYLTEAVIFSSLFENFNEVATLMTKYLTSKGCLVFYNEASKYYFDFEKEKLIQQLKFLVMDLEELNRSKDIKILAYYYQEKLSKYKPLSALVASNIKTRYEGLKHAVKYFSFVNPNFKLVKKDNKIKDVTYNYKF